jgi:hypothetical protein
MAGDNLICAAVATDMGADGSRWHTTASVDSARDTGKQSGGDILAA